MIVMRREELKNMVYEERAELVHEIKAAQAAAINNAGKEAQIEYLLEAIESK